MNLKKIRRHPRGQSVTTYWLLMLITLTAFTKCLFDISFICLSLLGGECKRFLLGDNDLDFDLDLDRVFTGDNEGVDDLDLLRCRKFGPGR